MCNQYYRLLYERSETSRLFVAIGKGRPSSTVRTFRSGFLREAANDSRTLLCLRSLHSFSIDHRKSVLHLLSRSPRRRHRYGNVHRILSGNVHRSIIMHTFLGHLAPFTALPETDRLDVVVPNVGDSHDKLLSR